MLLKALDLLRTLGWGLINFIFSLNLIFKLLKISIIRSYMPKTTAIVPPLTPGIIFARPKTKPFNIIIILLIIITHINYTIYA